MGIVVALVVLGYVALAILLVAIGTWLAPPRHRLKVFVGLFLTAVLIPVWDYYPGKLMFQHLCKSGGTEIHERPTEMGIFYRRTVGLNLGRGPNPVCDKVCAAHLRRLFSSGEYSEVLSIPGFFIEVNRRQEGYPAVYTRLWVDRMSSDSCIMPIDDRLRAFRGYPEQSCIAARISEKQHAAYTFVQAPFKQPGCEGERCWYSSARPLALGVTTYHEHIERDGKVVAKSIIYGWRGGWVTGGLMMPKYCPDHQAFQSKRLLEAFFQR